MQEKPYEYFPSAQRLLHEAFAEEVMKSPEILEGALENIDRWLKAGHASTPRLLD